MSDINDVYAIILGDGCVNKKGGIYVIHSLKQKAWLYYKAEILKENGFKFKIKERKMLSYGKEREFITLTTTNTSVGKALREKFYPEGKKILPSDVKLNPKQIMIIYLDDGRQNVLGHINVIVNGIKERKETNMFVNRYEFCKNSFDKTSISNLQNELLRNKIDSSVRYKTGRQNGQPFICISKKLYKDMFFNMLNNIIPECMRYKLSALPSLTYLTVRD